ncbi:MAG: transcriptional regulator [Spirochaetales bacterium]|nr:transcriptional regulator [Spirochaetales bacterium]
MEKFDYRQINSIFHSRIRLAVVSALVSGQLDFQALRKLTGATEGNLSTHLRKLEEAGFITVKKEFLGRRPRTSYGLTESGFTGFQSYVETLALFLDAGKKENT